MYIMKPYKTIYLFTLCVCVHVCVCVWACVHVCQKVFVLIGVKPY